MSAFATVLAAAAAAVIAIARLLALAALGSHGSAVTGWSPPMPLPGCPAAGPVALAFPSDSPTHSTGPGALAWRGAAGCGGHGYLLSLGPGGTPAGAALRMLGLSASPLVSAAPFGSVVLAAADSRGVELLARRADGGIEGPGVEAGGAPLAAASAYLGDVAVAYPSRAGSIALRLERHYETAFEPPVQLSGAAPARLALALDFRSDALVVWQHAGSLLARHVTQHGRSGPPLALAAAAGHVTALTALLSDDNRGMVAWSEQGGGRTRVWIEVTAVGPAPSAPVLLDSYADPAGEAPPAASPTLIRLRSESVMIAWDSIREGRWAVRAAPVEEDGPGTASTISAPGGDALLAGLVASPDGGALAVWGEPQRSPAGRLEPGRQALWSASGFDAHPRTTRFAAPEAISPAGPAGDLVAGVDASSGDALAVWRGAGGRLEASLRPGRR